MSVYYASLNSLRSFVSVIALSVLGLLLPTLHAEHDHDHLLVTIDRDLGYDPDAEIHKVQVSTATRSYVVTLLASHRAPLD